MRRLPCPESQVAEQIQSEREALKRQVVGGNEILEATKSQIRLVIQNAASATRAMVSDRLEMHEAEVERALKQEFEQEFPKWTRSLARMLSCFEDWLASRVRHQLTAVSNRERSYLLAPLHKVEDQTFRTLQHFRDRLSDRMLQALGVPLRTTEAAITALEPSTPDVRVGRVFDRNWELLSPVLPVWLIRGLVRRHFERTISYLVQQNLSRLTTQWEASIHSALWAVEKEARRRLDELIETVDHILETGEDRAPQIRADLERLRGLC